MSDRRAEQTPVFDQGPRGTCAACAVTSGHEWLRTREALSVEDAFHQAKRVDAWPGQDCTSVCHVLQGIGSFGHAIATAWPYGQPAYPASPPAASLEETNRRPLLGIWRSKAFATTDDMIDFVERHCVVLTLGFVPAAWETPNGVIDAPDRSAPQGAHAVLGVGTVIGNAGKMIIIKNSWGTGWGDGGYGYVTVAYAGRYLLAAHVMGSTA